MFKSRSSKLIIFSAFLAIAAVLALANARARRRANFATNGSALLPRTILWAWERPTNLSFIDPHNTGVAFLARTIRLSNENVSVKPRLQSLTLPAGTPTIAVARVETDRQVRPIFSVEQRRQLAQAIADMANLPRISGVQIDFDATLSERDFYRETIKEVRRLLPLRVSLSITALASWCMSDDWVSDLPIDEAVPMLFRMASDGRQIADSLARGEDFKAAPCRASYGISTDESSRRLIPTRRLYVFSPEAWTETSVHQILESRQ